MPLCHLATPLARLESSTSMVDLKVGIVNQKVAISMSRLDFAKLVVTCPAYLHLKIGHFCLVLILVYKSVQSNYVQIVLRVFATLLLSVIKKISSHSNAALTIFTVSNL